MLPKNKLYPQFLENLKVYNGPNHDLYELGLPQFDNLKPINFNKMFGNEFTPEDSIIELDPDQNPKEIELLKEKGFKIKEDPQSHLRDFMRTKAYNLPKTKAIENLNKKNQQKREKIWKKMLKKNYTYIQEYLEIN